MSEPSRKKDKSAAQAPLKIVRTDFSIDNHLKNEDDFSFWTIHPKKAAYVDLTILATGYDPSANKGRGSHSGRKFTGRPELLKQLMPHIRLAWIGYSKTTATTNLTDLRRWWCILDEVESNQSDYSSFFKPVVSVEDLNELHAVTARSKIMLPSAHHNFVRIVNLCLKSLGRSPLYWPAPAPLGKNSEVPEFWEVEKIRHQLKRHWFSALDRWEESDLLAEKHSSLQDAISAQNLHACYRLAADAIGDPNPAPRLVRKVLRSYELTDLPWQIRDGAHGRYPNATDIKSAFQLVLLTSGWNSQTLLDVDVTGKFIEPHPSNPGYHIVWGEKSRGNSIHFVVGRDKRSDSAGSILRTLEIRTRPLRKKILQQLQDVDSLLKTDPQNTDLLLKHNDLQNASRSPWLFLSGTSPGIISYLSNSSMANLDTDGSSFLGGLILKINSSLPQDHKVRESITPGDFRDAYIGFAYEFSNYNILTAQIAATHKSADTTTLYLRQRRWRAHSAKKIHIFTQALWSEIETRRVVDPAILRGLVDRGEVTEEQRIRWSLHKDRTRLGLGCKDFKNPPQYIAPQHIRGTGCRIQRCTLCEHGIVFDDSVDHLCRRIAELEYLRGKISVPSWTASSFPDEIMVTEAVLQNFEKSKVKSRKSYWEQQIISGAHQVPDMEGSYE
ncbi:MAG: hypothetical protein ACO1PM_20820 [Acidovorax sp.]